MWRNTSETFERKEKQNPGGETCVSPPGFLCARHGRQLGGGSPLRTRQQEPLAEGGFAGKFGVHREVESEGSRIAEIERFPNGQTLGPTDRNHI